MGGQERGDGRVRPGEMAPRGICVLTHGINGLPDDLDELGAELRAHGYATRFLTLPGHGTTIHHFAQTGWEDWLAEVEAASDAALAEQTGPGARPVFLMGHSLGAALTLAVAAERPGLAGIVAMCPPVRLSYATEPAMWALRRVTPFVPALGEDIRDVWRRLGPRRPIYRWSSTAAIHSLVRALPGLRRRLPDVRSPALVIAARHDHVVPVRDGREAHELLGSSYKRLVVLGRSFHAVARDVERHMVFDLAVRFCDEVVEAWPARPRMESHHEWWTRP
ncbi:MAG TPA: alpha/beta fold hydrolase [Ktedonobacterales bacterium]